MQQASTIARHCKEMAGRTRFAREQPQVAFPRQPRDRAQETGTAKDFAQQDHETIVLSGQMPAQGELAFTGPGQGCVVLQVQERSLPEQARTALAA